MFQRKIISELSGISLMKSGAPWTAYASVEAGLPAIGADLVKHV